MALPSTEQDRTKQAYEEVLSKPARRCAIVQNPGETIKVEIADDGDGGSVVNEYDTATGVAKDTPTVVVTYTVPVGKTFFFKQVEVSGSNRSTYKVEIAGSDQAKKRTYGSQLNEEFDFFNKLYAAGTVINVIAEHSRPTTGDFEARIIGNEV